MPLATGRSAASNACPAAAKAASSGMDAAKLLAMTGDAKRGAAVLSLQGKLGACYACHFINGTGRDFGPNLSHVATRLQRGQILERILTPSSIALSYFEPALSPATTYEVFFETEPDTLPPSMRMSLTEGWNQS